MDRRVSNLFDPMPPNLFGGFLKKGIIKGRENCACFDQTRRLAALPPVLS
jgi:hypothetical protein